jgi:hypothetical protein
VSTILTEFNGRRAHVVGLLAACYDQGGGLLPAVSWPQCRRRPATMTAATQETLVEIVDEIFLPLATNFGNNTQSED